MKVEKIQSNTNRQYFDKFLSYFPIIINRSITGIIIISLLYILTSYRILHDVIFGIFPIESYLIIKLYQISWLITVSFMIISLYLSHKVYREVNTWIEENDFLPKDLSKKELKNTLEKYMDVGFGPIPLLLFTSVYIARRVILLFFPSNLDFGPYYIWYLVPDIVTSLSILINFWSLLVYSYILYKIISKYPIDVNDIIDYQESYSSINNTTKTIIISSSISLGIFFFSILYWAFNMGTNLHFMASLSLLMIALVGLAIISILNLSGVQKGLNLSKETKIQSIRNADNNPELRDIQISIHSNVSLWKVGPKIFESVILPVFVTQFIVLLQYINNSLLYMIRKVFAI